MSLGGPIINMTALVQMMAWHRTGDKPLSELMLAYFTDVYKLNAASMG